ncbi:hypothetical protein P3X46_009724 [Hevea brasiliensis]|uniref:Uncharacterized protein n=1 Tax=Hevea brasiliensis TaxID=3981 RepID=A0ABQ9MMR7_HEVBR|nr:uncharacterized protein LOC110632201 [Hevea brasiliensis]KAJ9181609.1 hypothetical protein P3X46_009724 [Hevea brasiliensis]
MWQLLLAAAVAGSTTFVAKHLFAQERPREDENPFQASIASAFDSPLLSNHGNESGYESNIEQPPDGIFRFSSSTSSSSGKKTRILRKKSGITGRRLKFGAENDKVDKRSDGSEKSAKRFAVCLKKRRTAKSVPSKCGSCSSKDSSLFGCGLGIGIMYMMSAGKAEISKLSHAMDKTSKIVQELRTDLYKRKTAQVAASTKDLISKNDLIYYRSGTGHNNDPKDVKVSGIPMIDDVECPSSVLTEEPEPQQLEMDQLEAELASELQKLPWSYNEASEHEGFRLPNMDKNEASSGGLHELEGQSSISYQCHGVLPSELDQKLSRLLIEQQENQIEELESELHSAQSKLHEKEAELQALKDCVKRLNEFSLSNISDDEVVTHAEQECTSEWDNESNMGSESRKSVVGMKRPME